MKISDSQTCQMCQTCQTPQTMPDEWTFPDVVSALFKDLCLQGHSASSLSGSSLSSLASSPAFFFPLVRGLLVPRSLRGLRVFTGTVPSSRFFCSSSQCFLISRGLSLTNLQSLLLIVSSKHQRPGSDVESWLILTNFSKVQPWSSTPYFWTSSSW